MERWILVLLIGLTINLIVRTHQDVVGRERGSGGDDDDEVFSGDDGTDEEPTRRRDKDIEGSADEEDADLTTCQRLRKMPGAFTPRCTRDGEFEPRQCSDKLRECWCVDKAGREKPGSRQPLSNRPTCRPGESEFVVSAVTKKTLGALPGGDRRTQRPGLIYPPSDGDDIVLEDASTPKPFNQERTTERRTSKIQTTTGSFPEVLEENNNVQKQSMFSFIFKDPLILAGIIGGAVLALLCIVLLVMFTIYRMRKKDEGSYALDEPKKSYGFAYTRARDQEFFA
jgi:hypothetical protein